MSSFAFSVSLQGRFTYVQGMIEKTLIRIKDRFLRIPLRIFPFWFENDASFLPLSEGDVASVFVAVFSYAALAALMSKFITDVYLCLSF